MLLANNSFCEYSCKLSKNGQIITMIIVKKTGLSYTAYSVEAQEDPLLTIEIYKDLPPGISQNKYKFVVKAIKIHVTFIALQLLALKEIFRVIRDNYGTLGIDNVACNLDANGIELLTQAIIRAYIVKSKLIDQAQINAEPDLSKRAIRTALVDANAKLVQGLQRGHYLDDCEIVSRKRRSFAQDRVLQLLSHISSQLYNFCFVNKAKATEFQALYVNKALFITANENSAVEHIITALEGEINLQKILTTQYNIRNKNDRDISKRRANKIKKRVYKGEFQCDDSRYHNIRNILNEEQTYLLKIKNANTIENLDPGIYFVQNINEEHAEICLLSVLKFFTKIDDEIPIIYGKKRPCFTCHTELTYTEKYVDFEHGTRPGFFFKEAFYKQSLEVAQATYDAMGKCSKMYETDIVGGGYATLSDSDGNDTDNESEEEILSKSTNKLKIA